MSTATSFLEAEANKIARAERWIYSLSWHILGLLRTAVRKWLLLRGPLFFDPSVWNRTPHCYAKETSGWNNSGCCHDWDDDWCGFTAGAETTSRCAKQCWAPSRRKAALSKLIGQLRKTTQWMYQTIVRLKRVQPIPVRADVLCTGALGFKLIGGVKLKAVDVRYITVEWWKD